MCKRQGEEECGRRVGSGAVGGWGRVQWYAVLSVVPLNSRQLRISAQDLLKVKPTKQSKCQQAAVGLVGTRERERR